MSSDLEEEVLPRVSLKRVRSTSEKCKTLSKCSLGKKQAREFMDLQRDLVEEVLSRVPLTSLRRVRSTCKNWNTLFKSKSFANKHLGVVAAALKRELMMVMMIDYKLYLMSVNLDESCIKPRGKLISLDHSDQLLEISQVHHSEGLFLCLSKDKTRLVVWNPYLGQIRWIDHRPSPHRYRLYSYALGYDRSTKSHKILSFFYILYPFTATIFDFSIYDLNSRSGSWRVLDSYATHHWEIEVHNRGVSLKGNTYWLATSVFQGHDCFLVCFDFTSERFGPRLHVPEFDWDINNSLALSTVRDEQLVVLFQCWDSLYLKILVTTKIEPNAVSWSNKSFIEVKMSPLFGFDYPREHASFFINEEKKVAVVFDTKIDYLVSPIPNGAYIVGVDGSLKEVDLGLGDSPYIHCFPGVCPYVPSLLQLN